MGLAQRYEDVDQCGEDADLKAVGSKNGKKPRNAVQVHDGPGQMIMNLTAV